MKEIVFIHKNSARWKETEALLEKTNKLSPDHIASLYIQLQDDLAYSQTFFPQSDTTSYLNNLALKVHENIYRNKKVNYRSFFDFWTKDHPKVLNDTRNELLLSFVVFIFAAILGFVSCHYNFEFVRSILGDGYVDMTLENMKNGDPMAVYKDMGEVNMFFGITTNNIRVALLAYVLGAAFSVFTVFLLFGNGVMLGSFMWMFHHHGLLFEASTTIWLHGTLEIFAILVAASAGFCMGNALVFPNTYSRLNAFKTGALNGVKIIAGTIPLFVTAGFIEGFITRHTEFPLLLKLTVILLSAIWITWYYFIYPAKTKSKNYGKTSD